MATQAIMFITSWVIFNIAMREKPTKPPSAVAEVPYEALDFKQSFRALKENPNFLLLVIAFAIPYGAAISFGAVMSNIFTPFGYAPTELAFVALIMLITSVIGSVTAGAFVDKTGWYKYTMIFSILTSFTFTIMEIMVLIWIPEVKGLMYGLYSLHGLLGSGYVPLCFAYGAELTFPL